ncbi:MAG: hypothetical protein AAGI68_17045 [Planctomycetota bacterium]
MPTTAQAPVILPPPPDGSDPPSITPTLHIVATRTAAASPLFLAALLDQASPDDHLITLGPEALHHDALAVGWPRTRLHPISCPDAALLTAVPALRRTLRRQANARTRAINAHAWSPTLAKLTRLALPRAFAVHARLPHELPPQPTPRRLPDTPTARLCQDLRQRYHIRPDAPLVALLCDDPRHPADRPLAQPLAVALGITTQARRALQPSVAPPCLMLHPLTPGLDAGRRYAAITGFPNPLVQEPQLAAPWGLLPALDAVILPPLDHRRPSPHAAAWAEALGTPTLTAPPLSNTFPRVLATRLIDLLEPLDAAL